MLSRYFHAALAILIPITHCADTCYWPGGGVAEDRVPCDPNADVSHCCTLVDECLSNGLCVKGGGETTGVKYERGACTDQGWDHPSCPSDCRLNHDTPNNSSAYDFGGGEVLIWECGVQGYATQAQYRCESEAESQRCCSTTSVIFELPAATLGAFTGLPPSISAPLTNPPGVPSTESTGIPPMTSTLSGTNAPQSSSKKDDNAAVIGGAVGGAVGGIAVVVAAAFLILRRQRVKRNAMITNSVEQDWTKTQYANYGQQMQQPIFEMSQPEQRPVEMVADIPPQELPVGSPVNDLRNSPIR